MTGLGKAPAEGFSHRGNTTKQFHQKCYSSFMAVTVSNVSQTALSIQNRKTYDPISPLGMTTLTQKERRKAACAGHRVLEAKVQDLGAQWLRLCLPGFPGGSVVKNPPANTGDTGSIPEPTCLRATKPRCHNYWACALEPGGCNYWVHTSQLLKPARPRTCALQQGSRCSEKPMCHN